MKMQTHVDFRDKILKIIGAIAKVTAQFAEPGRAKDSAALAVELGRVRKWLKFLRVLRNIRNIPNSLTCEKIPINVRLESLADLVQMLSEDIHNLQKSGLWSGLLGLEKFPGLAEFEDQAWFAWAAIAAFNAAGELREALKTEDSERLTAASLAFLKYSCEVGDSLIALSPSELKRERQFIIASAVLGSVSALCSLHKFVRS